MSVQLDMSAEAIEARLLAVARQSPLGLEVVPRLDMSAEAVERRLAECAELSQVCRELAEPPE